MSIIQDFDLTNLDRLLRTFSERPQPLNLDTQLPQLLQALQADHLDLLPLPGPVSYTHLTLPTIAAECRSRWSPYH